MRTQGRRTRIVSLCAGCVLLGMALHAAISSETIGPETIAVAERILGLTFTPMERDSMVQDLNDQVRNYAGLRTVSLPNDVAPAILFNPLPPGFRPEHEQKPFRVRPVSLPSFKGSVDDLAFSSVRELAELLRTRAVTSEQLTRMYLDRLKNYGPKLECVITLLEERALLHARAADAEIASGHYRGYLHGIPYGIKDLFAVRGARTTWGAMPYKDQVIDQDAAVVRKLDEAGAVLVAKLTLGALAWGDVWYGGKTRNPWNYDQGSSGSSAGSASATAAGLVGFAIGTETWGSIVSPSTRCGTTGLRPTFGRVSRTGAMALSWSMDKIGPICRTAEDCALVFDAIRGPDGVDQTVVGLPFNYTSDVSLPQLRIGYLKADFDSVKEGRGFDSTALATLRALGAHLVPITLPRYPVSDLSIILGVESAAAFDDLTRSGRDDLLVRQIRDAWPNVFRASRFIPGVEYVQANRIRSLVIQAMATLMDTIDVYVGPTFGGDNLLLTNLTGHPSIVVPDGFREDGTPVSITFTGRLYDEGTLIAVAQLFQEHTGFHHRHPTLRQ